MCERWVGDWTNCNILTLNSFVFCSTSFSFCWDAQSGVLRLHSPLLGASSHYSILSPTNWLQLTELPVAPGYIIVWRTPASCGRHICTQFNPPTVKVIPDIFDRMHLFLDRRLGRRSICYISTISPCDRFLVMANHLVAGKKQTLSLLNYCITFIISEGRSRIHR